MSAPTDISMELIGEGESFNDELCMMIERAQMFSDFAHNETKALASYARAYGVKKGNTIFKEGEKGSFMCLLIEGRVDIYKETDTHEPKRITAIRPGKTMGEMALLDDLPHSATTIAAEDSKLVLITKHNFDRLNAENPVLANSILRKIAKLMSLRLRQTTGVLLDYLD